MMAWSSPPSKASRAKPHARTAAKVRTRLALPAAMVHPRQSPIGAKVTIHLARPAVKLVTPLARRAASPATVRVRPAVKAMTARDLLLARATVHPVPSVVKHQMPHGLLVAMRPMVTRVDPSPHAGC